MKCEQTKFTVIYSFYFKPYYLNLFIPFLFSYQTFTSRSFYKLEYIGQYLLYQRHTSIALVIEDCILVTKLEKNWTACFILTYLSNRSEEQAIWWELELVNGCCWATLPGELPLRLFRVPFVYEELDSVVCARVPRRLVWTYPNLDCVSSRQKFRTFSNNG